MNFLEIYEDACNGAGVRPNSLLHKTLREAPVRPITHLRLADNYVGPKGFLALIPLIEKCQTLESLDLRGNGLDNGSVIALARALRSHLGIHTVDLSRNPISAEGGRHLLELLEANQRIVHLVVEQTDLFDAFVERLYQAAAANQGDEGNRPIIVPTKQGNSSNNNNNNRNSDPHHEKDEHEDDETDYYASNKKSPHAARSHTNNNNNNNNKFPPSSNQQQNRDEEFNSSNRRRSSTSPFSNNRRRSYGGRKASSMSVMSEGGISNRSSNNMLQQNGLNNNNNNSNSNRDTSRSSQANITGSLKPKPPTPAIASEAYSRLTKEQRDLMKERYKQKAAVFTQVEQTASHKMAADFRAEIALLEGAQARADYSRQGLHYSPPAKSKQLIDAQQQQQAQEQQAQAQEQQHQEQEKQDQRRGDDGGDDEDDEKFQKKKPGEATIKLDDKKSPESNFFGSAVDESLMTIEQQKNTTSGPKDINNNNNTGGSNSNSKPSPPTTHPVLVSVPMVPITAPELASNAALTPADHFRALFNQGCAYYGEKNFDAAYCSWNEAVHIATQERNREWLTIVQSNLDNLSFEMLTTEAQEAIDRGDLDDASRSLELALKLATKARNAGWEAEVIKLRRNVLHGSFQSNHDKAASLLEQLIKLEPVDVTDDHRFVSPTGKLEAHTAAFVNEWTTLLIVKELLEHCVQSFRCAKGIGGNNGAALEQLVQGTATTVSKHLIRGYWAAALHDPMSLPWLGAGRFARDERESLLKLWADLRGTAKELGHALWSVVELSQYGNLLLASHELSDALDCFEKAAEKAGEISDRFLIGTSLLFCGIVNLQRSSYAKAEALVRSALSELGEVRFGVAPLRPPKASTAATAGSEQPQFVTRDAGNNNNNNNNNNKPGINKKKELLSSSTNSGGNSNNSNNNNVKEEKVQSQVPLEDLCFFHSQAFFMLSRTLIGSYRYRDALEIHERFLLYQHHDVLFEKLQSNFSGMPTTDHLRATSASLNHPLVYYAAHYRYDWNLDKQSYDVSEHIYSWIVASEGDGKFNSVDVSSEFGIASLFQTVKEARRTLFIDSPANSENNNNNNTGKVITNLDAVAWKAPLRRLYRALMHQVIDVLSSYAAYSDLGMFTVIPHGFLWLVPFPALLDERDQFLLERITLSHAMCATQLLMSELAVRHLLSSSNPKNMVVRPPRQLVNPENADPDLLKKNNNNKNKNNIDQEEIEAGDEDDEGFYNYNKMSSSNNVTNNNNKKDGGEENSTNNNTTHSHNKHASGKPATIAEVLRNGITEEQMNNEATEFVRALGSGTLEMTGTSADLLSKIAFTNISIICSSFVVNTTMNNNNNNTVVTSTTSKASPSNTTSTNISQQLLLTQTSFEDAEANRNRSAAMRGGFHVSSTFDTVGLLPCEEIAFASLPIETVVLPYTSIDVETISRDSTAESALSTSRGFLGAGTVSVVFSMWQCSDVYPADFLSYFARDLTRHSNRAIALARAVRSLIQEEQRSAMAIGSTSDESRPLSCFKPRRWAGIILLGLGEILPSMTNNNSNNNNAGGRQQSQQQQQYNNGGNFNEYNAFA